MDRMVLDLQEMLYQINVKHCGQRAADAARDSETVDIAPLAAMLEEQSKKYPVCRSTLLGVMRDVGSFMREGAASEALPPELFRGLSREQVADILTGVLAVIERHVSD